MADLTEKLPLTSNRLRSSAMATTVFLLLACASAAAAASSAASSAYVRVSQVGYEAGSPPFRAYLMSTAAETGATFNVLNSGGQQFIRRHRRVAGHTGATAPP